METKFPYFLFLTWLSIIRNQEFRLYVWPNRFKNFCSSSLWTCLHHMIILRRQNKITDVLMILDLGMSI